MSRSLSRSFFILVVLAVGVIATSSVAFASPPDGWHNEFCHGIDSGRVLCVEDDGSIRDHSSASGHWTYQYRGLTNWTIYAPDGTVEHTERTQVHVMQKGQGSDTHREQEMINYRYKSADYSCRLSTHFVIVDGELRVDREFNGCTITV